MRKGKAVYIQIFSLLLFIFCTNLFLPDASGNLWQGLNNCNIYNENWTIENARQSQVCDILPVFIYTENREQDTQNLRKYFQRLLSRFLFFPAANSGIA